MSLAQLELPSRSGAYRWYYADVACGDFTAVAIFMIGSLFSPRYSASWRHGATPLEHCAVNFALYDKGARWLWVLSEYPRAVVEAGRRLRIGNSTLEYGEDGSVRFDVVERTAPWGSRTEARLELWPECPAGEDVQLAPGQPHHWRPIAVRARGRLQVPTHGVDVEGRAYHDGNHGEAPLGVSAMTGWTWTRVHRPRTTLVTYQPDGAEAVYVSASARTLHVERGPAVSAATTRTAWGLRVPQQLPCGRTVLHARPALLESSPFYARLSAASGVAHAMTEVAHFERFHRPYVRWMAHFRTRRGVAP